MEVGSTQAAVPKSFTATNEIANPGCGVVVEKRWEMYVDFLLPIMTKATSTSFLVRALIPVLRALGVTSES